jgi:hypothetical protein
MELKVHYRVHKNSSPVPIRRQINLAHTTHPISLRSILILSTHLHLDLRSGLILSNFPTNIIYLFLPTFIYSSCFTHLTLLDLTVVIMSFGYIL